MRLRSMQQILSSSDEKYTKEVVGELSSKVLVDIYHVVIMELIYNLTLFRENKIDHWSHPVILSYENLTIAI